jgi:peptidoglycan/xylan/chitin deacetylase (PgdA/CDA1 family)
MDGIVSTGARWVSASLVIASLGCHAPDRSSGRIGEPAPGAPPEISTSTPFHGDRFAWPPGKKAAVSLTYDDALTSQLDNAVPRLGAHRLRATFFITENAQNAADRWSALVGRGHELAAHTMLHPCDAAQGWVKKGNALQDYDARRMDAELVESVALLKSLGQKQGPFTFAYPCGSTWIGSSYESYTPLVRKHFVAARGTAPTFADPANETFENAPSVSGEKSAEELVRLVDDAEHDGSWLILMFHGVGGDFMSVDLDAHEALLAHLEKRRDAVWTDTFLRVASYVMSHRPPLARADAGAADAGAAR